MVVMICAICFVASFVTAGCFGLASTGAMSRLYVSQSKQLVIGVNEELAPMTYKNETGEYSGFDIDYARTVCDRMGVQPKFVTVPAQQEEVYLQKGKIACYWSACANEQQFSNNISASDPYYKSDQVVLYLTGQPYKSLVDLKGVTVAVRKNSSAKHVLAQSKIFRHSLNASIEVDSTMQALKQLELNHVQAVIIDKETAIYYQKQNPGHYSMLTKNDGSIQVIGTSEYVVLFPVGNEVAVGFIEETMEQIKRDGTANRLKQRWFYE